jgi:hypothetical protein
LVAQREVLEHERLSGSGERTTGPHDERQQEPHRATMRRALANCKQNQSVPTDSFEAEPADGVLAKHRLSCGWRKIGSSVIVARQGEPIMAGAPLELRVEALEAELARLKEQLIGPVRWWQEIGTFADDPVYEQAMKLGRAYRRSLRPTGKKRTLPRHGRSRHRPS